MANGSSEVVGHFALENQSAPLLATKAKDPSTTTKDRHTRAVERVFAIASAIESGTKTMMTPKNMRKAKIEDLRSINSGELQLAGDAQSQPMLQTKKTIGVQGAEPGTSPDLFAAGVTSDPGKPASGAIRLSKSFLDIVMCHNGVSEFECKIAPGTGGHAAIAAIPSTLEANPGDASVGALTATSHEMRVEIEKLKRALFPKAPQDEEKTTKVTSSNMSPAKAFRRLFKLGRDIQTVGEIGVVRTSSLLTKEEENYFSEYGEEGPPRQPEIKVYASPADEAAAAKLEAEKATAERRGVRTGPVRPLSPVPGLVPTDSVGTPSEGTETNSEEEQGSGVIVATNESIEAGLQAAGHVEV